MSECLYCKKDPRYMKKLIKEFEKELKDWLFVKKKIDKIVKNLKKDVDALKKK